MSICVTENATSRRMLDEINSYGDQLESQAQALRDDFAKMCAAGDVYAPAIFADMVTRRDALGYSIRRLPTAGEVLMESLDYTGGPDFDDMLTIVLRAAKGEAVQADAAKLLQRMGAAWAKQNAEVV